MGKPEVHDQFVDHVGCRTECEALESLGPMVFLVSLLINAMSVQRFAAARIRHVMNP